MKLYEVEFTIKAVVVAETVEDAHVVAANEWRDIKGDQEPFVYARPIKGLDNLPPTWDEQCFPYGAPAVDKRIKDYLK